MPNRNKQNHGHGLATREFPCPMHGDARRRGIRGDFVEPGGSTDDRGPLNLRYFESQ